MKRSLLLATLTLCALTTLRADEPKRVIVCTVTTGFRHSSIGEAEKTLQKLADSSKAFTIVEYVRQPALAPVPKAPEKPRDLAAGADDQAKAKYDAALKKYETELATWTPDKVLTGKTAQQKNDEAVKAALAPLAPDHLTKEKIDGVIFANTTGDLPLPDKEGFIRWIEAGHAFMAMHSASDTFHHFPGYLQMLGGEFDKHDAQVAADLVQADPKNPATAGLPNPWNIAQEEMYQFKNHDRANVHVLWFLRHHPNHLDSKEKYAGVSWCKMAGKGKVFYTSLGHREDLWSDDAGLKGRINSVEVAKQFQQHILGGIKWALGLAPGDASPNPGVQ